ncbi:MAG: TlpA family protein disulfide reductase [Alphaproteobacteria bacterium]|nr:TlpA family protein disulfide reductase [Alphaproteobacteria bacterium]
MPDHEPTSSPSPRRLVLAAGALVVAGAVAAAVLLPQHRPPGPADADGVCHNARRTTELLTPLVRGEVAGLTLSSAPSPLPDFSFADSAGKPVKLSDFRGRTVLINLWATWCDPCRKEMPTLQTLQATLGGADFAVVAINIDRHNPEKTRNFLQQKNLTGLGAYVDSEGNTLRELKAIGRVIGMPASVLVDPQGCEIASLTGAAEWSGTDALTLIRAAIHARQPL